MKINENYRLDYDMETISIQKHENGSWHDLCSISETTAMAWEALARGTEREAIIAAIANEFDGADEAVVAADLDALIAQLRALGIFED